VILSTREDDARISEALTSRDEYVQRARALDSLVAAQSAEPAAP
jgi:hypothetical protein